MPKKLKILVFSMDGIGHLSACIGIIQALVSRGHDVFFLINQSFKGKVAKYGIREVHLVETSKKLNGSKSDTDVNNNEEETAEDIARRNGILLLENGFLSDKTSLEKMSDARENRFVELMKESLQDFDPQIQQAIDDEKPDLLIVDHFLLPPCFHKCGIPYAFIHSCSPLILYNHPTLPPAWSGYPTNSDPKTWKPFEEALKSNFYDKFHKYQMELFHDAGIDMEEYETLIFTSPYLNIYAYPKELDYHDIYTPPEHYFRIDSFCRDEPETDEAILPESFLNRPPGIGLVYFSLGSMGGADLDLMKKLTGYLSESKHRFVVAKGPRADEYEVVAENIYAGKFLPQTKILPLCDLVLSHGGNNSTTETLTAGKPLIVFPLFADQIDCGTRVEECGCGFQFNPYRVTKAELLEAIDRIVADEQMRLRTQKIGERISRDQSKVKLAERLERLVEEYSHTN